MEPYLGALLVCSFLAFVTTDSVEELRNKTEEVEAELKQYEDANIQLVQELEDQDLQAQQELAKLSQLNETVQTNFTAEVAKINEVREDLKAQYANEVSVTSEIQIEESLFAAYLLRNDLITQDIAFLNGWRKSGQIDKCKSQFSNSTDDLNEKSVLKVSLQRLTIILNYAKARNKQLNEEIVKKISLNNRMKVDLQSKLVENENDFSSYKNVTQYLQEELDEMQSTFKNVTNILESLKTRNEEQKLEVSKLEEKLNEFKDDITCYKELAQKAIKVPVSETCADSSGPSPLLC